MLSVSARIREGFGSALVNRVIDAQNGNRRLNNTQQLYDLRSTVAGASFAKNDCLLTPRPFTI